MSSDPIPMTPEQMPFAEIPNDQVVSVAKQFRETADFLYYHLTKISCVPPLMMTAAFGIELFLKSLNSGCVYSQDEDLAALGGYMVTAAPLKKGHALVALFDAIDGQLRSGLEAAYLAKPCVRGKATIRDALAVYDNLFVDSRYPFENAQDGGGRSITDVVRLLDMVADHVSSLPRCELDRPTE